MRLQVGIDLSVLNVLICVASVCCFSFTYTFSNATAAPNDNGTTAIPDVSIEDSATTVREGDAKTASRLVIDNSFIDPDNNCELCTRMLYTPGSNDEAGIAYKDETVDLGNTERIVFFAKGEQGQDVSFVAAGNNTSTVNTNDTDMFPRIDFAIATDNVTLKDDWQRFEIAVNDTALSDASYPFGVQMTADSSQIQTFYIKGVTADSRPAEDPLPAAFDSLNTTSNATQPLTATIDANSTSSPAPAAIEFGANTTGGLAPYSLRWNFGGGSNSTDIGEKVSHTFDKPGDYNITLAAKDSGTPSQNVSASMVITIIDAQNKTASTLLNDTIALANNTSLVHTNATIETNNTASMVGTNSTNSSLPASSLTGMNITLASNEQNTSQMQSKSADLFKNSTGENIAENHNNRSNVEVINHAPVAGDQLVVLDANETANILLRGSDQDSDPITFDLTTDPLKGSISGFDKKTGSLTYIPDPRFPGPDSFTFKVIDIHGAESNLGRILETVNSVQPLAYSALTTVDLSVATAKNDPVTIKLIASSEQNTGPLKFSLADSPSHGKLSELTSIDQKSARVTYYPEDGYSGNDIFKFNVDDLSRGDSASGKVSITVFATPPSENSPPVTNARNLETDQNKNMASLDTKVDSPSVGTRANVMTNQNLTREFSHELSQDDMRPHNEPGQTPTQSTNLVNHNPRANAGQDRTVYENTNDVTFKGTGKDSDGDRLSYSWEQTAGDPIIVLVDANTAKPKFDAPEVDEDKVLILRLTVADGNGGQHTDSVRITVKDKPVIDNQAGQNRPHSDNLVNHNPRANAGQDRTVYENTNDVTFKGTGKDSDGDRLSYSWEQTAGDPIIVLVDANTAKPKFDAPEVDEDKVLILRLTVADGNGGQHTDSVRITIKDKPVIDNQAVPKQTLRFQVNNQTSSPS